MSYEKQFAQAKLGESKGRQVHLLPFLVLAAELWAVWSYRGFVPTILPLTHCEEHPPLIPASVQVPACVPLSCSYL